MSFRNLTLLLAATLAAGCYAPEARVHEYARSWDSSSVRRVEVRAHNGRIVVEAGAADEIRMVARIRGRGRDRNTDPSKLIEATIDGDTLRIREKGSRRSISFFLVRLGDHSEIDFRITVPPRVELAAKTVNGRVEVEGVAGAMKLESVNGRIAVSTPDAEVTATTVNGAIRAEFLRNFRGARLRTVNGSIAVEVPADASLDLDIRQVNGSFRTDLPVVVDSSGRTGTRGSLHGGQFPLEIDTVNGSVRLRQAETVADPEDATRG
ncbi:MAG TPA: DUF4097 family beta strand repeat-containing protein [Thermoanaerobaculia bacterium]|nr:DUF4097 family beta strand repeat-containing protein [Thermoanaerobaculia bacterium]